MNKEPSEGSFEEPDEGVVIPPTKYYQVDETKHYPSVASQKKPFEKPDDGVIIEPSPTGYQSVLPPESQGRMDTQPLEVVEPEDESFEEIEDDTNRHVYGPFRRHWREPVLRLVAPQGALKWYLPFVYGGLLTLLVSSIFEYATPDQSIHPGWFGLGLLLPSYPVGREIYRWRRQMVHLEWVGERIVITCYEPTSIFWGFTGSGNGDSWKFEGSTAFHLRITFANRLIFWGCGDLIVSGKVEGGRAPSLNNIPHVRRVRAFLNKPA